MIKKTGTPDTHKVYVEAIANVTSVNFGSKKRKVPVFNKFVAVELTDAELRLTGPDFIEAARKALLKTLRGNTVTLINGNCELNDEKTDLTKERSNQLAFTVHPDSIKLTDRWLRA